MFVFIVWFLVKIYVDTSKLGRPLDIAHGRVPTMRNPPPPPPHQPDHYADSLKAFSEAIKRSEERRPQRPTEQSGRWSNISLQEDKRQRVYICGPITGKPDLNRPAFKQAEEHLERLGYQPVNPHEVCKNVVALHVGYHWELWQACMRADIRELVTCDLVAVLPDSDKSRGACLEIDLAINLGISVMSLNDIRA